MGAAPAAQAAICDAIRSRRIVRFFYAGGSQAGYRTAEPQLIAYNSKDNLCLSAWFLGDGMESASGAGWREYRMDRISEVTVLPRHFSGPRPGFERDGGKAYRRVLCALD